MSKWKEVHQSGKLKTANPKNLKIALNYLNAQSARIIKVEYEKMEYNEEITKNKKQEKEAEEKRSPLSTAISVVVGLAVSIAVIIFVIKNIKVIAFGGLFIAVVVLSLMLLANLTGPVIKLLKSFIPFERIPTKYTKSFSSIFLAGGLVCTTLMIGLTYDRIFGVTLWITGAAIPSVILLLLKSEQSLVPILGNPIWPKLVNSSMIESERMVILNALSEGTLHDTNSKENLKQDDGDSNSQVNSSQRYLKF
jgi:hypothetical protein